ncbi:MAG: hypothetical protein ACXWCV_05605 [Caldimonas sp.]
MTPRALLAALLLLLGAGSAPAQTTVYRCGNEYGRAPCSQGRVVETQNSATSAAQRAEAARVAARERRLAEDMARDRRRAEAAIKPALAGSLGPQKAAAPEAKAKASRAKKKKKRGKPPPEEGEDFSARVPKTVK